MKERIHTETIEYKDGDAVLEGFLAYDEALEGERPGVIVVHEWYGLNDYARMRARRLAGLGYVSLAADIYGKGIRPGNMDSANRQAGIYRSDIRLMRSRVNAALDCIRRQAKVNARKVAAIGYCFGGGAVLELARSFADLAGVVSFHGSLSTPNPEDTKIRARILALHGADDTHVDWEQVTAFRREMQKAGVDWQLHVYGGAVHSFTNPDSGNDPSRGIAYDERADRRSWQAMQAFFDEIFGDTG